jgi:hypothetical protein
MKIFEYGLQSYAKEGEGPKKSEKRMEEGLLPCLLILFFHFHPVPILLFAHLNR